MTFVFGCFSALQIWVSNATLGALSFDSAIEFIQENYILKPLHETALFGQ